MDLDDLDEELGMTLNLTTAKPSEALIDILEYLTKAISTGSWNLKITNSRSCP
ncbi:MAG: hypothetical protein ACLTK0_07645 [Anaerovoracaceae bacterium]